MSIFLGMPPKGVETWIKDHSKKDSGPLCFTAQEDGSSVAMTYGWQGDPITASLQISTDEKQTWTEWDGHIVYLNNGEKMYVKALNDNTDGFYKSGNSHKFVMEGKIAASGNIQYLLTSDGSRMDVPDQCYSYMFQNCSSLTQAPELPATTLAQMCYSNMFYNCQFLTQAPELPATTLADYCYVVMFYGCTSLTHAPELPATILSNSCYGSMFFGCSSLTQAPELPATTLTNYCYSNMFDGCTSLTHAPELPATILANKCYEYMFNNCNQFTDVHMKSSMEGVYNTSTHGDTKKTVIYDL